MNRKSALLAGAMALLLLPGAAEAGKQRLHGSPSAAVGISYSLGTVAAGLQPVADLETSPLVGIPAGTTLTPAASLPISGCLTARGTDGGGEKYVEITGSSSCTFTSVDFTGYAVFIHMTGNPTVAFVNPKFNNPNLFGDTAATANQGILLLGMGLGPNGNAYPSSSQTVVVTNAEFDGTGAVDGHEALIWASQNSATSLTISYSYIHDFPRDILTWDGTGTPEIHHNVVKRVGINTTGLNAHIEFVHSYQGTPNIHDNLWDWGNTVNYHTQCGSQCGPTSYLFFTGGSSPSTQVQVYSFTNNIVRGNGMTPRFAYSFSQGHETGGVPDGYNNATVGTIRNNAFDAGTSGSLNFGAGTVTVGSNFDYTTGGSVLSSCGTAPTSC